MIMDIIAEINSSVKHEQRPPAPSREKYGAILTADGFAQHPRAVEDYLNSLGLCPSAILLVIILSSYRWRPGQEIFPSVRTLAARLNVSPRRVNQLTAQLCELGLLVKTERFAERSQVANSYDLEPLYRKAAAWKCPEIAAALAEQEAAADAPFEPGSEIEEAAQIISEEFGEPAPRKIRYNAERLERRWEQRPDITWDAFTTLVEQAAEQTEQRSKEPTRSGKPFTKLVAYFFSALDYWLSKVPKQTTQPQQPKNNQQAARPAKASAPAALKRRIEATALTFRDKAVKSSVQRAANLMHKAQISVERMCDLVDEARATTSKAVGVKARMPYFFSILEQNIRQLSMNKI